MPHVAGFLNPIGRTPTFLIPLFKDHVGANYLQIQRVSQDDCISAFDIFDGLQGIEPCDSIEIEHPWNIGDTALWAFSFEAGSILTGTASQLKIQLAPRICEDALINYPLLEVEAASFCGLREIRNRAIKNAYKYLGGNSSLGAGIWRDEVILRPMICREILSWISPAVSNGSVGDLNHISVESSTKTAKVRLPRNLQRGSKFPTAKHFPDTLSIAKLFGLGLVVTPISARITKPIPPAGTFRNVGHYPWAPMMGPGVWSQPNSSKIDPFKVGPFGVIGHNLRADEKSRWPGRFLVVRNDTNMIKYRGFRHQTESRISQNITIVIQRTGFGSIRSTTIPLSKVASTILHHDAHQKPHLEHSNIFIVGSHILKRPSGFAPNSVASFEGERLAKSAASAIMGLVCATKATSLRELFSAAPSSNLGMAIRHQVKRDQTPIDALHAIYRKLLHPEAQLSESNQISLVLSPNLWDRNEELRNEIVFLTGVKNRLIKPFRLPIETTRSQISLIATGLPFSPPSISRFTHFCRQLLAVSGWSVKAATIENSASPFEASRNPTTICFVPAILQEHVHFALQEARDLSRESRVKCCIITNFTPREKVKHLASRDGLSIVHFSRVNEWFESIHGQSTISQWVQVGR